MREEGTKLVLRSSVRARVVALVLMIFPLVLFVLAVAARGDEREHLLTTALMCLALFGAIAWFTGLARWAVDDEGFQRLTPLLPKTRVRWDEVVWVEMQSLGSLTLRYGHLRHGRLSASMQVPAGLTGMDRFLRLLLANTSPNAIGDLTRRRLEERTGAPPPSALIPVDAPEPHAEERWGGLDRWKTNPFFTLGLTPECSRADVERAGQKLLALLAIGSAGAKRVVTPVGEVGRTEDTVRAAMAELRDPERRILHETWARLGHVEGVAAEVSKGDDPTRPWPDAMRAIRWGGS